METLEAKKASPEAVKAGSNLPEKIEIAKPGEAGVAKKGATPELSAASFSTYFTWRGSGTVLLNCGHAGIRASSRVVASISEYNTDANQNRFVGNAYMLIYNVAPYNGGVMIRLSVGFSSALNVRVDVIVDP